MTSSTNPSKVGYGEAAKPNTHMGLLAFCTQFVIGTDTFLTAPLLPVLQRELHIPTALGGLLVSAYAIGFVVSALFAGPISDALDRKAVIIGGVTGFAIFTCLCGFAWNFPTLFAARFLAGVASAFVGSQIYATIPVVVEPNKVVSAMGYATTGLAVAQVLGIPIGSLLSVANWRMPFYVVSGLAVLLVIVLAAMFPHVRPAAGTRMGNPFARYSEVLRNRKLLLSLLAYLVFMVGSWSGMTYISSWLTRDFGMSQAWASGALMAVGAGQTIGSIVGPKIAAKLGTARSLVAGALGMGVPYALTFVATNVWFAVALLVLALMAAGFMLPVMMNQTQQQTSAARGTVSALTNAAMYLGVTIEGAIAGPVFAATRGYRGIAIIVVVAFVLSMLIYAAAGALKKD